MTADSLARQMFAAKGEIDDALLEYERAIRHDAKCDDEARRAKARAYLTAKGQLGAKATVPEIAASVDLETADVQYQARLAEGLKRSAAQAVEGKRQWLSALQSLASLTRAEAQLSKWEPSETRSA